MSYHCGNLKTTLENVSCDGARCIVTVANMGFFESPLSFSGWANCSGTTEGGGTTGAKFPAERAEILLQKMKKLRGNKPLDVHPVAQSFNIVLDCVSHLHIDILLFVVSFST